MFSSCEAGTAAPRSGARSPLATRLTNTLPEALRVAFLSERQVDQMVTLLNAILDLEFFNDEEEQLIFKHAVCQVAAAVQKALPAPFLKLCGEHRSDEGLEREHAASLRQRLCKVVQDEVRLPYLDGRQEWQLVQCVVALVVRGMGRGCSFDEALRIESAGPIVMECFVKGNAGHFFSNRDGVVDALADDLDVPLIPSSWKRAVVARLVDMLAQARPRSRHRMPRPPREERAIGSGPSGNADARYALAAGAGGGHTGHL